MLTGEQRRRRRDSAHEVFDVIDEVVGLRTDDDLDCASLDHNTESTGSGERLLIDK